MKVEECPECWMTTKKGMETPRPRWVKRGRGHTEPKVPRTPISSVTINSLPSYSSVGRTIPQINKKLNHASSLLYILFPWA